MQNFSSIYSIFFSLFPTSFFRFLLPRLNLVLFFFSSPYLPQRHFEKLLTRKLPSSQFFRNRSTVQKILRNERCRGKRQFFLRLIRAIKNPPTNGRQNISNEKKKENKIKSNNIQRQEAEENNEKKKKNTSPERLSNSRKNEKTIGCKYLTTSVPQTNNMHFCKKKKTISISRKRVREEKFNTVANQRNRERKR